MKACCCVLSLLAVGCAPLPSTSVKSVAVEDVVRQVKREVGQYQSVQAQQATQTMAAKTVCGGAIDFDIKSVTVSLTTQRDATATANAGLTIPVGGPGTLGPSLTASSEDKQQQKLDFTFYPVRDPNPTAQTGSADPSLFAGTPLADGLLALRSSLKKASDQTPCFTFVPSGGGKQDGNAITYSFTIVDTLNAVGTYKMILFSAGASAKLEHTAVNSITIKFEATSGSWFK